MNSIVSPIHQETRVKTMLIKTLFRSMHERVHALQERRHESRAIALSALFIASYLLVSSPAVAQDCEVKIGVAGPMTGGGSAWGLAEKAGTEFEAAWTNANGGLQVGNRKCKITVASFDAQSTAAGGAAAANSFAGQNIHAVVGPIPSPETTGFKPVAKRHGQINFSHSFAVDVINPEFPLAFAVSLAPPVWGSIIVKAAKERFKFNSAVVLAPNDQGGTDAGSFHAHSPATRQIMRRRPAPSG